MAEPLSGVRILEVASHVFVPIAGGVLTEWGADVIKIEHPVTGDPYRGLVTAGLHKSYDGIDPSFQFANRGKQSVAVDLKKPAGAALARRMARWCDLIIENMRPGVMDRLGLGFAELARLNPGLVMLSTCNMGQTGPRADQPAPVLVA